MDTAIIRITPDEGVDFGPRAGAQAELVAVALNYPIEIKLGTELPDLHILLIDNRTEYKYNSWFVKSKKEKELIKAVINTRQFKNAEGLYENRL